VGDLERGYTGQDELVA